MSALAKLPVMVMKQGLPLLLEEYIADLLFHPLEGWMIGCMMVYDPSAGNLDEDEHIKDLKRDGVL